MNLATLLLVVVCQLVALFSAGLIGYAHGAPGWITASPDTRGTAVFVAIMVVLGTSVCAVFFAYLFGDYDGHKRTLGRPMTVNDFAVGEILYRHQFSATDPVSNEGVRRYFLFVSRMRSDGRPQDEIYCVHTNKPGLIDENNGSYFLVVENADGENDLKPT